MKTVWTENFILALVESRDGEITPNRFVGDAPKFSIFDTVNAPEKPRDEA